MKSIGMASQCEHVPICSAGTCSMGFTSRYSLQCCSPPDLIKLIGLMSYGISFRLSAMRTRHEHELLQYEYRMGCGEDIVGRKKKKRFYSFDGNDRIQSTPFGWHSSKQTESMENNNDDCYNTDWRQSSVIK